MNIFVLAYDPVKAAEAHCDKHVVKMVLETAQILSTAAQLNGRHDPCLYKMSHSRHPCVQWVAHSRHAFLWTLDLGLALASEYRYRYEKEHASTRIIRIAGQHRHWIPHRPRLPFVQAMPDQYKRRSPVAAYRAYYMGEKARFATWTHRRLPSWWKL